MPEEFQIPTNAAEAETIIEGLQSPEAANDTTPEESVQVPQEFALNYKGKEEKYPLEKLIQFAQQGRDYAEKMRAYNQEREGWTKQTAAEKAKWTELEQKFSRYSEVENYIKKDPAWWDHVQSSYQQKVSGQAPGANAPPDPRYAELEATVQKLASTLEQREQAQLAQKEDQELDLKVSEYRDKYPHFDWTTVDENGLDLEKRILDHAVKIGLNKPEHFTAAANDYLHEEHLKRAAESAKGDVGKHLQKLNKLGLGPITDKPTLKIKRAENVAAKSWDELSGEAIAALGLN